MKLFAGDTELFDFDEKVIQHVLNELQPSKALVFLYGMGNHGSSSLKVIVKFCLFEVPFVFTKGAYVFECHW